MTADHIIVTGGTGYLGARLVARALDEGRAVTLLGRRVWPAGTRHRPWTLGDPIPDGIDLSRRTALIHCAHDWAAGEDGNVAGTARLFASAARAGIDARVFVSSQSARADALNRYGRMKWAAEQAIGDATALRVGLVYGGPRQAMYGLLCRLARLPLLPMIEPARAVQPIHLDEVVGGMLAAADGRARGVLALAGPEPVAFGDVLRALARCYGGRRLPILPVPLRAALFACDVSARLPLIPTVDRERVLGLAGTEPIESELDLARLGIRVRPFAERLADEPAGRRALLAEAHALLVHAGGRPTPALLRRYARAMPDGAIVRPHVALRAREPLGAASPLARRMRAASRLVEASIAGDAMLSRGSRAGRLARLAGRMLIELALLPTRAIASVTR